MHGRAAARADRRGHHARSANVSGIATSTCTRVSGSRARRASNAARRWRRAAAARARLDCRRAVRRVRHARARGGASASCTSMRASARSLASGAAVPRRTRRRSGAPRAAFRIVGVVRDQQGRHAIDHGLHSFPAGPRQSCRRARTVRRRHRAGRDAPVAGRCVVHGVVEARRRQLAIVARQRLADRVAILAVAARRAEHGRERRGVASARGHRFVADRKRHAHDGAGAAALGRRQPAGGDSSVRAGAYGTRPASTSAACGQSFSPADGPMLSMKAVSVMAGLNGGRGRRGRGSGCNSCRRSRTVDRTARTRVSRLASIVGGECRVGQCRVDAGRHELLAQRERGDDGLERTRRAERMAGRSLRRAARRAGEQRADRSAFGRVVARRRGAVQVHVVDVGCTGRRMLAPARSRRARRAVRMRRRHVMRVARFADAEQQDRIGVECGRRVRHAFDERERGGFADRDAVARDVERPARLADSSSSELKPYSVVRHRIDAADDGRVDQSRFDHAARGAEHFRAG